MTIIHISSSLGGGGAEQMVLQLAKHSNQTHRALVFSISNVNTLEEKFKKANIEVHFLDITSFKNSTLRNGLKKLNAVIKDIDNGVFHCHQFHAYFLGLIYNLFYAALPIVFTLHSSKIENFNSKLLLFFTKPFRKKDIIFSTNVKKWYLKNNVIIPNGIDFKALTLNSRRHYNTSEVFSFLFLGRLSPEKNPLQLISFAEHLLKNKMEKFVIDVVGDGVLLGELEKMIMKHKLTKHFNVYGFQDDIKSFLTKSHCLILPSLQEGMPLVIIEAAATKLPVIATTVGSIPDFLSKANAYICNLDHFQDAMIEVIKDYDKALQKSDKLYEETHAVFSIESVFHKHLTVYKSVLNIELS